ncbi:MAG TPA: hypothetical protein VMM18_12820 [Gemmatimonadaceae bacterium]|nr:hypothetical protein [Gemmatimonadaceae bacterium]
MKIIRTFITAIAAAAGSLPATACGDFLSVQTPNVIDAGTLDPSADPTVLSFSAQQNLATAAGLANLRSGYVVWEAWNGFPTVQLEDFGLRSVAPDNPLLSANVWVPLSIALRSADVAVETLRGTAGDRAKLEEVRSSLIAGFAAVYIAELFCQGVINGGPPLTTAQMLDSAGARFTDAIDGGRALAGATTGATQATANTIVNAALVGRARAHLQAGRKAEAAADADQVSAGFRFDFLYVDNPAARVRLANPFWRFTFDQAQVVVAADFRVDDPRVPWLAPTPEQPRANDGITDFYQQGKWRSYGAPIRLASTIEAEYIAAEARGTADMLTLIAAQRAANSQPGYSGPTDDASVLTELMEQRGREFYLEGKRLGDFRRNPDNVLHVPAPGSAYFKPGLNPVGSMVCFPIPTTESTTNPNFP